MDSSLAPPHLIRSQPKFTGQFSTPTSTVGIVGITAFALGTVLEEQKKDFVQ